MATPVLKNRLLTLTRGKFRESEFGAPTFRDFLLLNTSTIRIDESSRPGNAILLSYDTSVQSSVKSGSSNEITIREDLWRSILDYSSGQLYAWDTESGTARPSQPEEELPRLPTLTGPEFQTWRDDFIETEVTSEEPGYDRIQRWQSQRLPSIVLPPLARRRWNDYLKKRVIERLTNWFAERNLQIPAIKSERKKRAVADSQTLDLRNFLVACIHAMSREEMLELKLPATVAFRVHQHGKVEPAGAD